MDQSNSTSSSRVPRRRRVGRRASVSIGVLAAVTLATAVPSGAAAPELSNRCASPAPKTTVAYRNLAGVAADATSLDVYAPARACRAPVVMWVHGGGYHIGDKASQVRDKVRLFDGRGWLFVSVNYRLTVEGDASSAHFPDHFDDVAAAVARVHSKIGRFGGDASRIALLGHSAGADIVSNVATNPRYLRSRHLGLRTIACAGPLDTEGFDKVTADAGTGEERAMWVDALGNEPAFERTTSAITWIRPHVGIPQTIGVVRGTPQRRGIEQDYLDRLADAGVRTARIDASGLSLADVNRRIGAPGDTVMTPPLMKFLDRCLRR